MSILDEMRALAERGLEEAAQLEATADELRAQARSLRAMARSMGINVNGRRSANPEVGTGGRGHKLPGRGSQAKIARAMLDAGGSFVSDEIRAACGWSSNAQVNDMLREWVRQDMVAHVRWEGKRKVYRVIAPQRLEAIANEVAQ